MIYDFRIPVLMIILFNGKHRFTEDNEKPEDKQEHG